MNLSLSEKQFIQVGTINLDNTKISYKLFKTPKDPGVYLWIGSKEKKGKSNNNNYADKKVCYYVGKAKDGPGPRMKKHQMSWQNESTKLVSLCKILEEENNSLQIWFRKSALDPIQLTNCNLGVSHYSLEEEALINYFDPILNIARPPTPQLDCDILERILEENEDENLEYWSIAKRKNLEFVDLMNEILSNNLLIKKLKKHQNESSIGIIGGYSNQQSGFNNTPLLVFGKKNQSKFVEKYAYIKLMNPSLVVINQNV